MNLHEFATYVLIAFAALCVSIVALLVLGTPLDHLVYFDRIGDAVRDVTGLIKHVFLEQS